jgi:hypothetical protein
MSDIHARVIAEAKEAFKFELSTYAPGLYSPRWLAHRIWPDGFSDRPVMNPPFDRAINSMLIAKLFLLVE